MDENLSRGYIQLGYGQHSIEELIVSPVSNQGDGAQQKIEPNDKCRCIYFGLVLAGVGFLLPYNSFVTAVDFYQDRYPGSTIIFDISLTYICIAFGSVCINNILVELLSLRTRITVGYIVSFLTMLVIAVCDIWLELFSSALSYTITLIAVGVVALGCTVQQSSFYGYTSMLPSRYTQAVMTGESAAGVFISSNRIITKALLSNEKQNTLIFFCMSIVIVLMCFICFQVIRRTEFVKFYLDICKNAGLSEDQRNITTHIVTSEEVEINGRTTPENYGVLGIEGVSTGAHHNSGNTAETPNTESNADQAEVKVKGQGRSYRKHLPKWEAVKRGLLLRYRASKTTWPYMLSICLAYFVTLCLFPGIESEIVSCTLGSWMPVILMAIFNLFDFIGKIIASIPFDWPKHKLVLSTICRVILVPLLMICAMPRGQPILSGEGWAMLLSLLLGITNGYFGSVPMILAATKVPDEQKELTGNIMTLSYSIGLTSGSAVAYLLDVLLGPYNGNTCPTVNTTITPSNVTGVSWM